MRLFPYSTPSWLKVMGGVGGGGLCDFSVRPESESLFLFFFIRDFVGLGLGLWTCVRQLVCFLGVIVRSNGVLFCVLYISCLKSAVHK